MSTSGRVEASFGNYSLTEKSSQSTKDDEEIDNDRDNEEEDEEDEEDDIVPDPDTVVEYDVDDTGGKEVCPKLKRI